jgi:thiol-disulfide isomerase/thioredoxin
MRHYIKTILLCLCLTACTGAPEAMDLEQQPVKLSKPSQWVLLTYWAEWCKTCRDEVPALNDLAMLADDIKVFGVYFQDKPADEIRSLTEQLGMEYAVLTQDPAKLLDLPDIKGLPTHFLISPEGKIVGPVHGKQDETSVRALIASA